MISKFSFSSCDKRVFIAFSLGTRPWPSRGVGRRKSLYCQKKTHPTRWTGASSRLPVVIVEQPAELLLAAAKEYFPYADHLPLPGQMKLAPRPRLRRDESTPPAWSYPLEQRSFYRKLFAG